MKSAFVLLLLLAASVTHAAFPKRGHLVKTEKVMYEGREVFQCTYKFVSGKAVALSETPCLPVITVR